jgi:hypothetical protein
MTAHDALSTVRVRPLFLARCCAWFGLCLSSGCADEAIIQRFNDLPLAVATVFDPATGGSLDVAADGGLAPVTFPYAGAPVRIVLDARGSHDPDGQITSYRWLSGTRTPDAGVPARAVPSGQTLDWPADEVMPAVDLGPGLYTFTLWVRDERGAWSLPDTIRVVIGSTMAARPADAGTTALGLSGMDAGVRVAAPSSEGEQR